MLTFGPIGFAAPWLPDRPRLAAGDLVAAQGDAARPRRIAFPSPCGCSLASFRRKLSRPDPLWLLPDAPPGRGAGHPRFGSSAALNPSGVAGGGP